MGRRKRYSEEFKREALRRADEPGVTDVVVAEELETNACLTERPFTLDERLYLESLH